MSSKALRWLILPSILAMSSKSLAITVEKFAARPCVARALEAPFNPQAVLGFFFGVDYSKDEDIEELRQGHCMKELMPLWYSGGPAYDELAQPFADVIDAVGQGQLQFPSWQETVDGKTAKMILCDQLARNVFRGTEKAFAYDHVGLDVSRELTKTVLEGPGETPLEGEFYPPYLCFMVTALMHSEAQSDHVSALDLLDYAKQNTPSHLEGAWEKQREFELEHKAIIDRFGRYPHRNTLKERSSTPEEQAWLEDIDNLPGWAKSHMKS